MERKRIGLIAVLLKFEQGELCELGRFHVPLQMIVTLQVPGCPSMSGSRRNRVRASRQSVAFAPKKDTMSGKFSVLARITVILFLWTAMLFGQGHNAGQIYGTVLPAPGENQLPGDTQVTLRSLDEGYQKERLSKPGGFSLRMFQSGTACLWSSPKAIKLRG
ncbi:hypothetical protein MYX75_10620 [Acidobacteria bacterium AH-259-A15]|nr:hypothetical protein [Acidobacteria bacterium AH-259-A15]